MREWSTDYSKMGKGVTLSSDKAAALKTALSELLERKSMHQELETFIAHNAEEHNLISKEDVALIKSSREKVTERNISMCLTMIRTSVTGLYL